MQAVTKIQQVRNDVTAARKTGKSIGFVPTMGALHAGHISLIERASARCDFVVVSIFVNPTQFGDGEDIEQYPRDRERDVNICSDAGAHLVFAPSVEEMYPAENLTWVDVDDKLTRRLCGEYRQGHFRGVTTVCAKLFNIVNPDVAYFGQKDAQQSIVIKKMAADLNMTLKIEVCPTVREKSGLAISSRNQYLSDEEKQDAALIYAALEKCRQLAEHGQRNCRVLTEEMKKTMSASDKLLPQYIKIVNTETLEDLETITDQALAAIAAKIGSTRLIDNIIITPPAKS